MKNLFMVIPSLFLCGCATVMEMGTHMNNVDLAVMNRRNLVGMTREQLVKEFGEGGQASASYAGNSTYERFQYTNSMGARMNITVVDGLVQNVTYN